MPNGPTLRSRAKANPTTTSNKQPAARISSGSRTSLTSTAQKSLCTTNGSRPSTPAPTQITKLSETVKLLESRLSALEATVLQLTTENTDLKQSVAKLHSELTEIGQRTTVHRASELETCISTELSELNNDIVIRGVEVNENTPETNLRAIYEGIRSHLCISDCVELDPVSVSVLPVNTSQTNVSINRPIRVQLRTLASKVKFLQVRRVKKDIYLSDIGINNQSKRPILITEHLTRRNQELLFQARSLRGGDNFKFVWSTNGQILARKEEKSKVIRITDSAHVNRLRAAANLEPLPENGRFYASSTVQSSSNHS